MCSLEHQINSINKLIQRKVFELKKYQLSSFPCMTFKIKCLLRFLMNILFCSAELSLKSKVWLRVVLKRLSKDSLQKYLGSYLENSFISFFQQITSSVQEQTQPLMKGITSHKLEVARQCR